MDSVTSAIIPTENLRNRALGVLTRLPPFSPILNKLMASLAKEDVFFGELSGIIEQDTVLAGNVLKLVNSALYSRSGTINSVRHAVSILGISKLRNVALSLMVTKMWQHVKTPKSWSQSVFNYHCAATAVMADLLAQHLPAQYPEGAFTAGLMHGMGKLLIAIAMPEEYDILLIRAAESTVSLEELERDLMGIGHAELGALAMEHWKLPPDIREAVATQNDPPPDRDGQIAPGRLLFLAHRVVCLVGVTTPSCTCREAGSPEAELAAIGLGAKADRLLHEFHTEFEGMRQFF